VTRPHLPPWLEDAVAVVVADHEAEAVFLVGPQAAGEAAPGSGYDLLAIVDNDRVAGTDRALEVRVRPLSGFERPVSVLTASLAEVMAGLYSGHAGWTAIAREAFPIFDPLDLMARLRSQVATLPPTDLPAHVASARADAQRAEELRNAGEELAAGLLLAEAALRLTRATAAYTGHPTMDPSRSVSALARFSPGGARALVSLLTGITFEQQIDALRQFADAVEAAHRLKDG
jgi:hypothetical protein